MEISAFSIASGRRRDGRGSAIANFSATMLEHAESSEAQLFQDLFALHFSGFKRDGYFVEIGTGDGKTISNTYLLEKQYGWRGIVVEPNPTFLPSIKTHRQCVISTQCILDITGREVEFRCTADPEFSGISAEYLAVSEQEPEASSSKTRESEVLRLTTLSLTDLLLQNSAPIEIDFMSIDVEGAEFQILSTFDLSRWNIGCICVEHNFTNTRAHVCEILEGAGYIRVFRGFSQWDDWYVHRRILEDRTDSRCLLPASTPAGERGVTYQRWASEALKHGDLEVATDLCARAAEINPKLSSIHRTLAEIAQSAGKPLVAIAHWQNALEIDSTDYWAHVGLATLLLERGQIAEAVQLLTKASSLTADSSVAQLLLNRTGPKVPVHSGSAA